MVKTNVRITFICLSSACLAYTWRRQSGSEATAVVKLMEARMNDDGSLISASALPACLARMYVEGRDPIKVWHACSLVPEVRKMKGMKLIPVDDRIDLFCGEDRRIKVQTWVRLR
jgi:hypothetical protein